MIYNRNVYDRWGYLVEPIRFSKGLPSHYWRQAHEDTTLSINYKEVKDDTKKITQKRIFYLGCVSMHLGHFLLESLQKFIDIYNLPSNIPVMCDISPGVLPKGIKHMPMEDVEWILRTFIKNKIINPTIGDSSGYHGDTLYIPEQYVQLSSFCNAPNMFSDIIKVIVSAARETSKVRPYGKIYLARYETKDNPKGFRKNNPKSKIYDQIARISYAKELMGDIGSNTHLSIFSTSGCKCTWTQNRKNTEGVKNQAICDMIKSFNTF